MQWELLAEYASDAQQEGTLISNSNLRAAPGFEWGPEQTDDDGKMGTVQAGVVAAAGATRLLTTSFFVSVISLYAGLGIKPSTSCLLGKCSNL